MQNNIILTSTLYFIVTIANEELQKIVFNHSSDINFRAFMNLYKKYTAKPYSSVATDASFTSDNPLHLRIKISLRI